MPQTAAFETKTLPMLECKMSDEGNGTLEGYASVKHEVDSYGDVILDGAYQDLEDLVKSGWSGFNHEGAVGMIVEAREDTKGLWTKIAFHSDAESQAVRTKVKERLEAGKSVGMSIMYKTLDASWGERDGQEVRELKAVKVVEAGAVLLPAAKSAVVTSVKDGTGVETTLAEDLDAARELAERAYARLADLSEKCDGELTSGRKERIKEMAEKFQSLHDQLQKRDSVDDPEVLTSLEPDW